MKDFRLNAALTDAATFMGTAQEPVPAQAPLQPVKTESAAGVAVRVAEVPLVKLAEQELPQSMPEGDEVTVPFPVLVTVRS